MRLRSAASLLLAAAGIPGVGLPRAEGRAPFLVKKFLLGRLEPNTYKFIATGARGTQNAYRDNLILLVFSGPVDFDSLDSRTVRIGIPSANGLLRPADGQFYKHVEYKPDLSHPKRFSMPSTGGGYGSSPGHYVPKKIYRNRVLFDPTASQSPDPLSKNPDGFQANTTYSVTLPGVDGGTTKVVRGTTGDSIETTFTTTFRTTAEHLSDW